MRSLAAQFGSFSRAALQRHKANHVAAHLAQAVAAAEVARADTLLENVRGQVRRADRLFAEAESVLDSAKETRDARGVLNAVKAAALALREARNGAELIGRLAGELGPSGIQVNIVASSEWAALRAAIIQALEPHPLAQRDVLEALRSVQGARQCMPGCVAKALPAGGTI